MKKLKTFLYAACMAVCVSGSMMMSSCGDDDSQENNGEGNQTAGNKSELAQSGKLLLTRIVKGNEMCCYEYDSQLRPVRAYSVDRRSDSATMYQLDYSTGQISLLDEGTGLVEFTPAGYLSRVKTSWDEKEDGEVLKGALDYQMNYDTEGHLVTYVMKYSNTEDGETEQMDGKCTLTWSNGNVVKIESATNWKDADGKTVEENLYTQTFIYGNQPNKFYQYPGLLAFEDDYAFFATELVGKGSAYLATAGSFVEKVNFGGVHTQEYVNSSKVTFTLNSAGAIETETWTDDKDGSTDDSYQFYYTSTENVAKQIAPSLVQTRSTKHSSGYKKHRMIMKTMLARALSGNRLRK